MGKKANLLGPQDPFKYRRLLGEAGRTPVPLHLLPAFLQPDSTETLSLLPPHRPVMEVPCDKPFPEEQARLYLRDIILGLEYCE